MGTSNGSVTTRNNASLRQYKGSYFNKFGNLPTKDISCKELSPKKLSEAEKQTIRAKVNRAYRFKQVVTIGIVILLFGGLAYLMF